MLNRLKSAPNKSAPGSVCQSPKSPTSAASAEGQSITGFRALSMKTDESPPNASEHKPQHPTYKPQSLPKRPLGLKPQSRGASSGRSLSPQAPSPVEQKSEMLSLERTASLPERTLSAHAVLSTSPKLMPSAPSSSSTPKQSLNQLTRAKSSIAALPDISTARHDNASPATPSPKEKERKLNATELGLLRIALSRPAVFRSLDDAEVILST